MIFIFAFRFFKIVANGKSICEGTAKRGWNSFGADLLPMQSCKKPYLLNVFGN